MDKFFKLKAHGTTTGRELVAGLTTFVSMCYVLVVVPNLLHMTGMPIEGSYLATILIAAFGTALIGMSSNYPMAIAPGMGTLAFFVFSIVLKQKITWQAGMAVIFVTGILFTLISMSQIRTKLIDAIPDNLKHAIVAGLGLFIGIIGLSAAKVIVGDAGTIVGLGNLHSPTVYLTMFGFLITAILLVRNIPGAIFIGMIATAAMSWGVGVLVLPASIIDIPRGFATTFMQLDFSAFANLQVIFSVLVLLLILLFDTTGTLLGLCTQAKLLKDGKIERAKPAFLSDSVMSIFAGILGTSPSAVYVESGAGIAAGGRTGLTSIFAAIFFLACLFFQPLAMAVASVPAITAPALLLVAYFMTLSIAEINWGKSMEESIAAFVTLVGIPLSYSVANGVGMGIITYVVLRLATGKGKTVSPILYFFAVLFVIQFIYQ
ncbi:MAG: NCS2 family permease [Bacillota bacterium]